MCVSYLVTLCLRHDNQNEGMDLDDDGKCGRRNGGGDGGKRWVNDRVRACSTFKKTTGFPSGCTCSPAASDSFPAPLSARGTISIFILAIRTGV